MSQVKKGPGGRPIRIPLGTRNVLTAPKRKGYVRRFVNDDKDRIQQFESAGYKIVRDDVEIGDPKAGKESQIGSVASKKGASTGIVLLEIKEEWYKEDQKAKQDNILVGEKDMKRKLNTKKAGHYGKVDIG